MITCHLFKASKCFWNKYYENTNDDIIKPSNFVSFVYTNYVQKYNNDNVYLKIADVGAGNCRDTIFFSNKKNLCYGIDINGVLDTENINCKLIKKDANSVLKNYELRMLFDIIYMRWFLHALPYNVSNDIFINALHNLKSNGLICIEVRSINDNELKKNSTYDKSFTTTHKRWLYSIDMCKELASNNNCDILYCEEGYFSPNQNTETSNPLLIRFICRKKLLPYYEKSENYTKYKHIVTKMKSKTMKCYDQLIIFNKTLEEHNIKYISVAGTSLGLNRHGGIIPWDNDIDLGFMESEWEKLLSIKDILIEKGLSIHIPPKNHKSYGKQIHFGLMDCFKLNKINYKFYKGVAGTYVSVDEYNNVSKQIFGYTYIYAPFCNHQSLEKRYGTKYFDIGDINDNYHFKDRSVKNFKFINYDLKRIS